MDQQVSGSELAEIEAKPQPQRGSEFAGFWTEQNPVGNKPVELPRLPRDEPSPFKNFTSLRFAGDGDSDPTVDVPDPPEKTSFFAAATRPEVEIRGKATAVNLPAATLKRETQGFDSAAIEEPLLGQDNPARVHSAESFHRQRSLTSAPADAVIRRVDDASILSSRRSANQSSRSLCQGCLLEETFMSNPPHVLPLPPGRDGVVQISKDEILFPGDSNRLPQLNIRNSRTDPCSRLSKEPVLGGSCREAATFTLGMNVSRAPNSLPTSPCSSSIEFLRALRSSRESRASKLFRKLKISGIRSRAWANVDTRTGKRNSISKGVGKLSKEKSSKSANKPKASQQQQLVQSWETRIPELRNHGERSDQDFGNQTKHMPTIHSECMKVDSSNCFARPDSIRTRPSVRSQEGNAAALHGHSHRTRGSRWLFRWRWCSKPTAKLASKRVASPRAVYPTRSLPALSGAARGVSPTANIKSEARTPLCTKSERFMASGKGAEKRGSGTRPRHRRGSSWGCASRASTAVLSTPGSLQRAARNTPRPRFQDDQGATESSQARGNLAGARVSRVRPGGSQSSRIEEAYQNFQESSRGTGVHSFRSTGGNNLASNGGNILRSAGGHSFRSAGGHSFRSIEGHSFRSAGGYSFRSIGSGGGQSFRKDPVFEDCRGSFRSAGSPGSYGSFRSVDSPSMRSLGGSNRFLSVEEMEWDSRLPPPLQGDQNLSVDVAALCNSSLKFVFKCREVQHFNRFLRTQRKCILRGSEKGNTDRFHVILSGADIEVSSMVTAICYAWFLENTVPKVTGETWHAIPVLHVPRHQMHKHRDAAWLFDACGIDAAALLFSDEIVMASLGDAGRVKTSTIGQDVLVTRNEVGSVCTLLGEKLLADAQCLLEARYMKTLLLAGILLETENLDFASKRDTDMTTILLVGSGSLGRNGFFNQLKGVVDDVRVSKFIARSYGDDKQPFVGKGFSTSQPKMHEEADQEHFDKDSLFTPSQDQTSTSEAGTTSSLDEDSPRLKQSSSFKYTKLHPQSTPARSHQRPSPSLAGCHDHEMSAALRRKAATWSASANLVREARSLAPSLARIQKRLFLYQA